MLFYYLLQIFKTCKFLKVELFRPPKAFEMSASNIRYGPGVTKEVGFDFKNLGCKNVLIFTDENLAQLEPMKVAVDSMTRAGVNFEVKLIFI